MKLRTYGYFIRQAFKSIFRNGWMSAASIATVSVSLIILGAFVLVVANTNYIASQMESDVEIAAYLEVETPEEETEDIQGDYFRPCRSFPGGAGYQGRGPKTAE